MKRKFLIVFVLSVLFGCVIGNKSYAMSSSGGYDISNYNIKMVVNEDNSFDITEKIKVYFSEQRHGIYRTIPLRNDIARNDGTRSRNRAKIENIDVDEDFSKSVVDGNMQIKIGDANELVYGYQDYEISYTYRLGKDPLKNADELYFNLIGNEWDANIARVDFEIIMPEEFDEDKLGFTSGVKGSTNNSNVQWDVDDNVITGTCYGLNENEGLTIRLELPDEYFEYDFWKENKELVIVSIICFLFIIYADYLWRNYGKDEIPVETVEFYPPDNLNSADMQFVYDGNSTSEGILSLLIYLANKGYLKIELDGKDRFGEEKFTLIKLKEYDGNNRTEKIFFDGLFGNSKKKRAKIDLKDAEELLAEYKARGEDIKLEDALEKLKTSTSKDEVSSSSLKNRFYTTITKIHKQYRLRKGEIFIDSSNNSKAKLKIIIMLIITLIFAIIIPMSKTVGGEFLFVLLFPIIATIVLISSWSQKNATVRIFSTIWAAMFGGIPLISIIIPLVTLSSGITETAMFLAGIITIIALLIFIKAMPKRNEYGTEMLGRVKGFRNFLETAEKERLETLVFENSNYFFDILPYTYALGVSKKWVEKFEYIALEPPTWYSGYSGDFSSIAICHPIDNVVKSTNKTLSSVPSSSGSSGGGFSGGGSSGGGSGGGRRWLLVKK